MEGMLEKESGIRLDRSISYKVSDTVSKITCTVKRCWPRGRFGVSGPTAEAVAAVHFDVEQASSCAVVSSEHLLWAITPTSFLSVIAT